MEEKNQVAQPGVKKAAPVMSAAAPPASPIPTAAPKQAAPAFRIEAAKQRKRYLNFLVYGDYGVGKSYLIGTASEVPEMKDVLYISAEGGDLTIEGFDLDIVPVYNYAQFARVHEFLRLHCKYRDAYREGNTVAKEKLIKLEAMLRGVDEGSIKEPKLYNTVGVDSLSEVQKYCMYQLLGIKVGEFSLDIEPETPQWAEWGKSAEMIRLLVRSFRDLPMHVLFVCARAEEQDHQKRFHYKPLLPGKLANEIQGFFDVVGYLMAAPTEGEGMHRRLWLEPGQTFQAKNRFTDFKERYLDDPSMSKLISIK